MWERFEVDINQCFSFAETFFKNFTPFLRCFIAIGYIYYDEEK